MQPGCEAAAIQSEQWHSILTLCFFLWTGRDWKKQGALIFSWVTHREGNCTVYSRLSWFPCTRTFFLKALFSWNAVRSIHYSIASPTTSRASHACHLTSQQTTHGTCEHHSVFQCTGISTKHRCTWQLFCCGLFLAEERSPAMSCAGRCAAHEALQWDFCRGCKTLPLNQVTASLVGWFLLTIPRESGFKQGALGKQKLRKPPTSFQKMGNPHLQRTGRQKGCRQATHSRFDERGSSQGWTLFSLCLSSTLF